MPSIAEQPACRRTIMVVDDNPANLKLMEAMLDERYEVQCFPLGRLALAAANDDPPDLILLDINMPDMDGYEVCGRLKSSTRLCEIPVIFISALTTTEDKVKGFRSGGADYVSKPFQMEEVQARVETHLNLRRAIQAERDLLATERELLERTLGGAVGTLMELIQITSPVLVSRSNSIRDIVLWITSRLEIRDAWQYELSAQLCLLGCMMLPNEIFEKAYGGQDLSPHEDEMFRAHPEVAASLISRIPRLEVVAAIVRMQQIPGGDMTASEQTRQGSHMLHLALELDRKIYQDVDWKLASAQLRRSGKFNGRMLDALSSYCPTKIKFEVRQLLIRELRSGMVLDEDVFTTKTRMMVLKSEMVLTNVWIERLGNFARTNGVQERFRVRVPRIAAWAVTEARI
jgi:response regulator RpfG family c-di-GMP phosphodiesterase